MNIENILVNYYYSFMLFLFLLIIILFILNFKIIVNQFYNIRKLTWILVGFIFILGLLMRIFFVPHIHQVFYDEFYHLNIAENMAKQHKFCYCSFTLDDFCYNCSKVPEWLPGFHFLLSFIFNIFGIYDIVAYAFNTIIGSITPPLFFILGYLIFRNEKIAVLSQLILTVLPVHLKLSGSTANDITSLFFILLLLIILYSYLRNNILTQLYLLLSILLFCIYVRIENFILIFLVLYFLWQNDNKVNEIINPKYILIIWILFILLLIPRIIHFYYLLPYILHFSNIQNQFQINLIDAFRNFITDFAKNFFFNLLFWIDNRINPIFYTLFSIYGLVCFNNKKIIHYLVLWFMTFYFIYSSFKNGGFMLLYTLDNWRYTLPLYIPIILMASYGIYEFITLFNHHRFLRNVLYIVIFFFIISIYFQFKPFILLENSHQENYLYLKSLKDKLPNHCPIIISGTFITGNALEIRYTLGLDAIPAEYLKNISIFSKNKCYLLLNNYNSNMDINSFMGANFTAKYYSDYTLVTIP
jgi:hypothetical protein